MRQGDAILPKLCKQDGFKNQDWEERCIKICRKQLNKQRYANDIALITDNKSKLQESFRRTD